ncbi:hypothetical protein GA0070616_2094 [Micromonospora nigra]|uniref:Uncharacterized protein n=1 Tax=Micromonospora nigra TaxID=145857 RepID=A0A1C6RUB2_9ACTN|nr:hypothetical protein [Micromonospora nigra]SCL20797.1 hypothetical protein GA0070616_2094 [Micromonospora nigra]
MARRTNLPASSPVDQWEALVLDVERPARPALRMEVAGRGLLVLRQADRVVLMAEVDEGRFGVEYALTGQFRPPVPPLRSSHVAALGSGPGSAWQARWAHHVATALIGAPGGPLHTGRWVISAGADHLPPTCWPRDAARRWTQLLLPQDQGSIDWFASTGAGRVLPLRRLPGPDDGRVRSYRKQAREGILAPVLLWWISGLDCHVVLDGHARLVAALAEHQEPPLLALSTVCRRQVARDTEAAVHHYAATADVMRRQVAAGTPGAVQALVAVNRRFARDLRRVEAGHGATRAWPLRGGTTTWNDLARAHVADWYAEVATADEP